MAISRVKTWASEVLTAADLNAEFNNIINNLTPANIDDYSANDSEMQTTADPYPAGATSRASDLSGELARIRYVLAQITGETYWYIDPDNSLLSTGTKTFATVSTTTSLTTDTIAERTAATGVTIDGCLIKDGGISDGTNIIKHTIIAIGDWNMDTTAGVTVNHGLTLANIRDVRVSIVPDVGSGLTTVPLDIHTGSSGFGGYIQWYTSTVNLTREAGGYFDGTFYDATSFNRGWVVITHVG